MSYSSTSPAPVLVERRRPLDAVSLVVLAVFLLISAAVALFGALTTISTVDGWYADAQKVAWSPPNWLFGPVWTTLYAAMAVAAWLVWRRRHFFYVGSALTLYVGQLFLNSVWTPVFFGGYEIIGGAALWIGLAVIVVLDICVAATIVAFWQISRPAAILLMPYLAWILYATTLNLGLAILNT
jgi:benzodiazapine receptor